MPIRDSSSLDAVLHQGRQLPSQCYTDSAFYKVELDTIFGGWMAVGFASEIAKAGSVLPLMVGNTPIVVTRDAQFQLNVFANVCRHRGHLLVAEKCERAKSLTCPYHAWSYGLDGRFLHAPYWDGTAASKPTTEEQRQMHLIPVRFEVWYDIIVVDLSGKAPEFAQTISPLQQRWQVERPAELLRCFSRRDYTILGNWKLVVENFLDNYHLPWVHPEVGSDIESAIGLGVDNLQLSDDIIGFSHATSGKDKSKTATPLPAWPGISDAQSNRQDLFFIFANICMVLEGNYLWTMLLTPDGPGRCLERVSLYVIGDEALSPQHQNSRDQLAETIYRINDQDENAVQKLQSGRRNRAASLGVFNPVHDQLGIWFHQQIANRLIENV